MRKMTSMDRNTSPISPFTKEDFVQTYSNTDPNLYPEVELTRFKNVYGEINGFDPDEIELANGSDEWLQKLMITLGGKGVMSLSPDFFMYEEYANQIGVPLYKVESNAVFEFDFAYVTQEIREKEPSLFILSNPHNPTGKQFSEEDLNKLSEEMKNIGGYFVIDEAYIEFGEDYKRPTGEHVIILRTMSKIYGMAGLRIGIINASNDTYEKLTSINHPYPLNNLNLNLASGFLESEDQRQTFTSYQKEARNQLFDAFDLVKDLVNIKDSSSNFVFTYGENAIDLGNYLKAKGFDGRFYTEENLKDVVRYSIIDHDQYPQLIEAINEWKEGKE